MVALLLLFAGALSAQRIALRGTVFHSDSVSPLPFVYLISRSSGNGTMTDQNGRFLLLSTEDDTLICSYVGYHGKRFPVKELEKNDKGEVSLIMKEMPVQLQEVAISTFKVKPYERTYMQDIIDRSKMRTIDMSRSPITALYMRYSKEGRQIRKLSHIFQELLTEEQVQKRFNPEILRKLTGDEDLNYDDFRRYCFFTDTDYILSVDDMTLYTRVMECYRRWKREVRRN